MLARAHVLMFILDRGDDARALLDREGVDAAGAPLPESLAFRAALLVGSGDVGAGMATATSALGTWRFPHSPRSWRTASTRMNIPYMPGWV